MAAPAGSSAPGKPRCRVRMRMRSLRKKHLIRSRPSLTKGMKSRSRPPMGCFSFFRGSFGFFFFSFLSFFFASFGFLGFFGFLGISRILIGPTTNATKGPSAS